MNIIAVNEYCFENNNIVKHPVLLNVDTINTIRLQKKGHSYSIEHYEIYCNNTVVRLLPEDIKPVWNAIGTCL